MNRHRRWLIVRLKDRDGSDCMLCYQPLKEDITIDHIVPRSLAGKDELANLQLAHRRCNEAKGGAECLLPRKTTECAS